MMWTNCITGLVLFASIISIHTLVLPGSNLNQALSLTGNPLDPTFGLSGGNAFSSQMGMMQPPAYLTMAPSVETICTTQSRLLHPIDRNGRLSDLVGKEIARRSPFLAAYPNLAGTGKWGCAANYYTNTMKYRPSELGNAFGDLIDSTGCDGFTCDVLNGVQKKLPMSNFLNAMLINQMMQRPSAAPAPTHAHLPTSNTGGQPQPPIVSQPPTNQQPPTPSPAKPTNTSIQNATPAANNGPDMMTTIFNNPVFQEQMRRLIANMMNQNNPMNQMNQMNQMSQMNPMPQGQGGLFF